MMDRSVESGGESEGGGGCAPVDDSHVNTDNHNDTNNADQPNDTKPSTGPRRTHRGTRANGRRRQGKPYAKLTWEERRLLEQQQQPQHPQLPKGKRSRRGLNYAHYRPPAPANSNSYLADSVERDLGAAADSGDDELLDEDDGPYGFSAGFTSAVYGDLSRAELISLLAARDEDLDKAKSELESLRRRLTLAGVDLTALQELQPSPIHNRSSRTSMSVPEHPLLPPP